MNDISVKDSNENEEINEKIANVNFIRAKIITEAAIFKKKKLKKQKGNNVKKKLQKRSIFICFFKLLKLDKNFMSISNLLNSYYIKNK